MNAMLERLSQAPLPAVTLLFKGAFGLGMLALILVGALFFLLGRDYTLFAQISVAAIGAILGAFCARRISKLSSDH